MARIDFPSNPSDGQTLTVTVAGANTVYTYNATYGVWRAAGSIATSSSSGASVTTSNTAPSGPSSGDLWWNSMDGNMYVYYNDGDSNQWVQSNPAQPGPTGPTGPSGEVARSELDAYLQIANLSSLSTSIVPSANVTFDLGSQDKSWKDLYLSGNTIFLGTSQITLNANGGIDLPAGSRTGGTAIGTGSGGGASVTISDTAPGSPSAGDLWWSANTSELFIYYNDTDTSQWVQATTPGATGPAGADGADGSSVTSYANTTAFPSSGNSVGDFAFATNTKAVYIWDGAEWDRISAGADESPVIVTEPPTTHTLSPSGNTSSITMTAQDPEGFGITYGVAYNTLDGSLPNQLSSATTIDQSNGVFTFTPTSNTSLGGEFKARLSASDGAKITTRLVTVELGFTFTDLLTTSMVFDHYNAAGSATRFPNAAYGMTYNGLDNTLTTSQFGAHNQSTPSYLAVYIGTEAKAVNQVKFNIHSNHFGDFELQGSNDADTSGTFYNTGNWTALTWSSGDIGGTSLSGQNGGGNGSGFTDHTIVTHNYTNGTPYTHYRIVISNVNNYSTGTGSGGWASYGWQFNRV